MKNPLTLSNTILNIARSYNISITPMKLQKLLYFIYKKYIQITKQPLFAERFEVWQFGPVLKNVYMAFNHYGNTPIKEFYKDSNDDVYVVNIDSDPNLKEAFEYVWDKYREYDAITLSELTHLDNTAWSIAKNNNYGVLKDEDIQQEKWFAKS
ncbi:MAG: DUF4065 domain-containing protein [Clostridiales bacterium]|jgi:uncharacterized phage-associated protein|nr:DUF4065 domain-containing protein [Clostridiales bacterium]